MKNIVILICIIFTTVIIGCNVSSNFTYIPSSQDAIVRNSLVVDKSKDSTWSQLVEGLSSGFLLIKTMDKQSGFMNLNYTGDPEKYVEGGELRYTVTSGFASVDTFQFPASQSSANYEKATGVYVISPVQRNLDLEARINILLSELSSSRTRLTVNTTYVLNLNTKVQDVASDQETISFNTGQDGVSKDGVKYRSNGKLEQIILDIFK